MKCRKIHKLLSEYLDGELSQPLHQEVGEHLAQCPACERRLAQYQGIEQAFIASSRRPVPPDFVAEVTARIQHSRPTRRQESLEGHTLLDVLFRPFYIKLPLELAAVAAVVAIIVFAANSTPRTPFTSAPGQIAQITVPQTTLARRTAPATIRADEVEASGMTSNERLYLELLQGQRKLEDLSGVDESAKTAAIVAANIENARITSTPQFINTASLLATSFAPQLTTPQITNFPALDANRFPVDGLTEISMRETAVFEKSRQSLTPITFNDTVKMADSETRQQPVALQNKLIVRNNKTIIQTNDVERSTQIAHDVTEMCQGQVISQSQTGFQQGTVYTLLVQVPKSQLSEFRRALSEAQTATAANDEADRSRRARNEAKISSASTDLALPKDLLPSMLGITNTVIGATKNSNPPPARTTPSPAALVQPTLNLTDLTTVEVEIHFRPASPTNR